MVKEGHLEVLLHLPFGSLEYVDDLARLVEEGSPLIVQGRLDEVLEFFIGLGRRQIEHELLLNLRTMRQVS